MLGSSGPTVVVHSAGADSKAPRRHITPGTTRRIFPYLRPYAWPIALLVVVTTVEAVIMVAIPLLLKALIDDGIMPRDLGVVVGVAIGVGVLALLQAAATFVQTLFSGRVSEGLVYDLRSQVFEHVQRQPLAFFTRAQTGSLVSRLNTDVVGAQQALTTLMSTAVPSVVSLVLAIGVMIYLSWQITIVAVLLLPLFVLPGRLIGRRMQVLMRESMQLNAEMGQLMQERFNVAGALLSKLYGRPAEEVWLFRGRARRVRDIGVVTSVYMRLLLVVLTLVAALATAVVYGVGGALVVHGAFQLGTMVALATLLTQLFGPINQLSSMQANVMTALVSFDRLFELLDLPPLIAERPGAADLPTRPDGAAPEVVFDHVAFRYPAAAEVSLASLESIALPSQDRGDNALTLHDLSFTVPAGRLTALVGPSGAGKTTITHLLPRLYDPTSGSVRIDGVDIRDVTLGSLTDTVGMVTQDAHLFHDTIRANLLYARPAATEDELVEACRAAQIWDLVAALPDGFDTVVGDRGYRMSGGEKQRLAIARLLLKAPSVVILDEATAHLDSESEAALQQALKTALTGRTSLVIAHRLSTIREADQILVVDRGEIIERGRHEDLLARGGLYAELYKTQFAAAREAPPDPDPAPRVFEHVPGEAAPPPVHGLPPLPELTPDSGPSPLQVLGGGGGPPPLPPPPGA